ncbi:MAG: mannose-1-phosphate guanylyltransferase [Verrucomicrobiales bacterium]|jgi:mannose-1-phosphate guanylyltransferase
MAENHFALILAGGSGARFWPLSRHRKPKQLLALFDEETLIEKTISRLDGLIPRENILILTNADQLDGLREIVDLPAENILAEPAKRDTAPAVALGAGWVARRNPEATMAVLPADHLIQDTGSFHDVVGAALAVASKSTSLVTVGIKPTWPCPSYGYIERGQQAEISSALPVFEVEKFREKPDSEQAAEFLAKGNFSWNAGMFFWSIPTVVSELSQHAPELANFVNSIQTSTNLEETIEAEFQLLPKISIDFALMEKASSVLNIEATFDWDDVGGWPSVAKYLNRDDQENSTRGLVTQLDSTNNIVYNAGGKRIALLGVNDLIVVETEDAILIANRNDADGIKKLVDIMPEELK